MTVVAVDVDEGEAREEVCFLVEEIVTTLEFLKVASPLPTWMEISAVFLSAALSGEVAVPTPTSSVRSKEHCIPTVHFSGTTLLQQQEAQVPPDVCESQPEGSSGDMVFFLVAFLRGRYL